MHFCIAVNVYTIHLEHDRVFYLDHLVVSDLHISEEVQKKGEDGLMERCYYWGTEFLNREYPLVIKCRAAHR